VRVLLDEHLPVDLALELAGHDVDTVAGRGWAGIASNRLQHLRPLVPAILAAIASIAPGQVQRVGI
jgi:hypothetical protein